jgi:hypothetical protein
MNRVNGSRHRRPLPLLAGARRELAKAWNGTSAADIEIAKAIASSVLGAWPKSMAGRDDLDECGAADER